MKDFIVVNLDNSLSDEIINLILPIQQTEFGVAIDIEDQPDLLDIETHYYKTGGGFWGVLHEGKLLGTIALISIGHRAGAIRKMFVKKEFRGKEFGIAQKLIETLINYADEQGIKNLFLGTVDVMKAAQRFYERNGFQQIAKADLPHYFPLVAVDKVFYHLDLEERER